MKVLMIPTLEQMRSEESGIKRVIEGWHKHLPAFGVEFVDKDQSYDIKVSHAGTDTENIDCACLHGLYWTADYNASSWEWKANARVIEAARQARVITVPSEWVAETVMRDMRRRPVVVPHGIDWNDWQHEQPNGGYILWNKNRSGADVCSPEPVGVLAGAYPSQHFVSTFMPKRSRHNINAIGVIPHDQMKLLVQGAAVYLSTTKETFCIGALEAMAAGVPVLGYAHGGNLSLIEHGVNGYLAEPDNEDDLVEGLNYCLKYRDTLGDNGREMARKWTWGAACEKVMDAFAIALSNRLPSVSVIIPSYNYGDEAHLGRAIDSVLEQSSGDLAEILVVDDGSGDGDQAEGIVQSRQGRRTDVLLRYIRQDNMGVAVARNRGVADATSSYVCCLDADDALEPEFLEKCVRALERDHSLGIAYTGLRYILPDGKTGISPWPGEWDFDKQLKRQNQVPTCCVYRKEMWEQLGGYKKRYCPIGAGSEDAEFWTRSGAYGWKAQKVTAAPLFVYSWQSGRVSGNKEYQEPDWLAWHPWAFDDQHPFASYATPKRFAHPVRQYDEPVVSVVIPVGPGHAGHLEDALDSLEAQTFRKWEAIVVWDGQEPDKRLETAYPYVRFVETGLEPVGAGAARNLGAEMARSHFLLFLDADDWLYPHALDRMLEEWKVENAIIYSDYVGKAFISNPEELSPDLQQRIIWQMPDGLTAIGYEAPEYNVERAQAQPVGDPSRVYTWNLITSLVPKAWHDEAGGFDEALPSWEDVDYWWRLAKLGKCFMRVPEPLVVYHFYSGGRRDLGAERHKELFGYLRKKHERMEVTVCVGCGRSKVVAPPPSVVSAQQSTAQPFRLSDDEFKMCVYTHPNRGQHPVIGSAVFRNRLDNVHMIGTREGFKIHYGFRGGGEKLLVHREDIKLNPHLFRELDIGPKPPPTPKQVLDEPMPIVPKATQTFTEPDDEPLPPPAPKRIDVASVMRGERLEAPVPVQVARNSNGFDLQKLPGITHKVASAMTKAGITDLEDILDLGEEGLQGFEGIGPARARGIYNAAMERAKDAVASA